MKNAMKFLTLCVLAGVVVGMCGCTAPNSSNNNAVPILTNTTHNATTTAKVNKTAAVVKQTVKPTTPTATPAPAYVATPSPVDNTPVATPIPQDTRISAPHVITVPTATPTSSATLTWTSDMPPQSGVMQGGYADFMAYYNDHPASGLGAFYTPKWYVDGQLVYTGTPTQAYVSWGADTANLSIGSHTVTLDAAGTGLSITATFTVIPAAK